MEFGILFFYVKFGNNFGLSFNRNFKEVLKICPQLKILNRG